MQWRDKFCILRLSSALKSDSSTALLSAKDQVSTSTISSCLPQHFGRECLLGSNSLTVLEHRGQCYAARNKALQVREIFDSFRKPKNLWFKGMQTLGLEVRILVAL